MGVSMTDLTEVLARAASPSAFARRDAMRSAGWTEPHEDSEIAYEKAKAQLAALDAAGYQIVPQEPTPAMLTAGNDTLNSQRSSWAVVHEIYRAMSEAAPKP
jgi:hypothetical protein